MHVYQRTYAYRNSYTPTRTRRHWQVGIFNTPGEGAVVDPDQSAPPSACLVGFESFSQQAQPACSKGEPFRLEWRRPNDIPMLMSTWTRELNSTQSSLHLIVCVCGRQGQASATRGKDASGGCTAHAGLGEANGADDPAIQKEACGGRDSSEKGNLAVGEEEGEREGTLIPLGRQIRGRAADAGFTWSDGLYVEEADNSAAAADEATDARARAMRHARPIYEVVCDDLKLLLAREVEDSRHDDEPGGRVVSRRGPAGGGDKGVEAVRQVGDQLSRRVGQLNSVGKFKTA